MGLKGDDIMAGIVTPDMILENKDLAVEVLRSLKMQFAIDEITSTSVCICTALEMGIRALDFVPDEVMEEMNSDRGGFCDEGGKISL